MRIVVFSRFEIQLLLASTKLLSEYSNFSGLLKRDSLT